VVQAEPEQYGLLNTSTALDCSTTLNEFDFLVDIAWFRGEGTERTPLNTPLLIFESTAFSDEGVYTCKVNINELGIVIERIINFKVVGKYTNYFGLLHG
jgi:hypothetical protein